MSDSERAAIPAGELESEMDPGVETLPELEAIEPAELGDLEVAAAQPEVAVPLPAPSLQLFEHGGLSLYYESWGDNGAPAVVALHEAGHDLRSWWPVIRALGGDYRVIGIDPVSYTHLDVYKRQRLPGRCRAPTRSPTTSCRSSQRWR